jgi:beta-phosphoglucomutase-like phosphatase (HAD superfamily)
MFHVLAWERALGSVGRHIGQETIRAQIGKGADLLIPAILSRIEPRDHEALTQAHAEIFKSEYLARCRRFPVPQTS